MGSLKTNYNFTMKKAIITLSTLLLVLCVPLNVFGQMNRTLETKVADILAQLPTKDLNHSDNLMKEIISLDLDGILQFSDMLVPLGTGDDTNARYAVQSLAIYAGGLKSKVEDNIVEQALLNALKKARNNEVKTFLIERLVFCGSQKSIKALRSYLKDEALFKPALSTLIAIGTTEVGKWLLEEVEPINGDKHLALIDALGILKYQPAVEFLETLATSQSVNLQQYALRALAEIASLNSKDVLIEAANNAGFRLDETKAIIALINYGERLKENGNATLSVEVAKLILKNCTEVGQLHFRSSAIHLLREIEGTLFNKTLLKEAKNKNEKYSASVIDAATENLSSDEVTKWVKAFKKYPASTKPLVIRMLSKRKETLVFDKCILPALEDDDTLVRITAIKALSNQEKSKALPVLLELLNNERSLLEYKAVNETLLKVVDSSDSELLAGKLYQVDDKGKKVLVNVLSKRDATDQFEIISELLNTSNEELKATVYSALPFVSTSNNLPKLIAVLSKESNSDNIEGIQKAIVNVLNGEDENSANKIYDSYNGFSDKSKLVPILASLSTDKALELVSDQLKSGDTNSKQNALKSLANWKQNNALPLLFQTAIKEKNNDIKSQAFRFYLNKTIASDFPNDQKLLLVKKLLPYGTSTQEKKQIIKAASKVKTFLSLVFVSEFLDDKNLLTSASNAVIKIALPTPGKKNGLSGDVVRSIISKCVNNLTGPDSQYVKIDVKEFLDKMSDEKGYVSIFNGKDLTGWEGLVKNPIARGKMSKGELERAQAKANEQMLRDWFVKDGVIGFKGEGYNNICTIKDYGDFEMLVDWKITNGGDSGIYLRGTPQVQIWDIARTNVGAQVGSGGLYNNQKNERIPLEVADNPINDWNTFRIKMVGERVTVYLNGVLVTDNVALENYWDRKLPIFTKEAIELQAHGEDLGFRNVYVREIESGDMLLSEDEKKDGFKSLFNGKDLDHFIGNKTDYLVESNEIFVNPKQGGHGNLYTAEEYSDFVFKFEFKLTPGANNGLGIHTPLKGDAAYVGKELQILDNTAAIYKNLKSYQYHGSVYGIIAAKRGFLKPVGEWNSEEVIVKGDNIKIILNGQVIVDGNMTEASKNGTADQKDHPGLKRNKGHIGFLGHGSELWFRNIRIKDLNN